MYEYEYGKLFIEMTDPLEAEHEQAKKDAYSPESRPIPEGLEPQGTPLGHIAFQGDFDQKPRPSSS